MEPSPVVPDVVEVDCERVIRGQQVLIKAQRSIIDAVRELHQKRPKVGGFGFTCTCQPDSILSADWPCATARVVFLDELGD